MAPSRNLDEERVPSGEEQKAIDKCIKQLNDRASPNTVLRAKKIVLQFVCRDYCCMAPKELDKLRTKDELYEAAASWVRAPHTGKRPYLIFGSRLKSTAFLRRILHRVERPDPLLALFLGRILWKPFGRTWRAPNFPPG